MFNCFKKSKSSVPDEMTYEEYANKIFNYDSKSIHDCDDNCIVVYRQPDMLVNSYNLFDYTNMRWSNVFENTYWNGYSYYTVRIVV